jgi:hypothetical protein
MIMPWIWCSRRPAFLIAVFFCFQPLVIAQPASNASASNAGGTAVAPGEVVYVLRTYEVSDLVVSIQDHPFALSPGGASKSFGGGGTGGGMGGGGGMFSVPDPRQNSGLRTSGGGYASVRLCQFGGGGGGAPSRDGESAGVVATPGSINMDDLKRVLVSTVAADSWAENGSGEGEVQSLGTALVVWQSPEVHEMIHGLLRQIRLGVGDRKTMTVDARWIFVNSDELDRLMVSDQQGVPTVDRDVLAEFSRRAGSIRGITNCFSSQLVYLVSGVRRNVVSGYIPVVGQVGPPADIEQLASSPSRSLVQFASDSSTLEGGNGAQVGYQPIVDKPNLGVLLEIRPTYLRDAGDAIVDLKSTLTNADEQVLPAGNGTMPPTVDRIAIGTHEFATTLRMPLGKPVLVGGLTQVPPVTIVDEAVESAASNQTAGAGAESPQLYLVLELR